jgi:hypothetical protein
VLPQQRSTVSSITMSKLPPASTNVSPMSRSKYRLVRNGDQQRSVPCLAFFATTGQISEGVLIPAQYRMRELFVQMVTAKWHGVLQPIGDCAHLIC